MSPTVWMSPAVTSVGPVFFTTMRFGPSPCILMAMSLILRMMSVTSSRTPAMEENSWRTPSMCTDCTLAPCKEESRIRRSALPSVNPKPRSNGSATTVAEHFGSGPGVTWSLFGRISSCQFFWIVTSSPIALSSTRAFRATNGASWENPAWRQRLPKPDYTRRRLRGRQPLCGIGVTSRIDVMVKPAACKARNADSRPDPGPATCTSRVRMPCSWALRATSSPATWAAYGVDLRDPLKPMVPEDDHAIALPWASVIVIIVLLNDAFTWATPEAMFLRSRRRTRTASLPILNPFATRHSGPHISPQLLLLAGDRLGWTFTGPRIGVGALAANRQAAPMP